MATGANERNDDDDDGADTDADAVATRSVSSIPLVVHPSIHPPIASDTPIRFFFKTRKVVGLLLPMSYALFAHRMGLRFIAYERLTNRAPASVDTGSRPAP